MGLFIGIVRLQMLKTNNAGLGPILTRLDLHDDPWGTNRKVMQRWAVWWAILGCMMLEKIHRYEIWCVCVCVCKLWFNHLNWLQDALVYQMWHAVKRCSTYIYIYIIFMYIDLKCVVLKNIKGASSLHVNVSDTTPRVQIHTVDGKNPANNLG